MSDNFEKGVECLNALCDDAQMKAAGFGDRLKVIRDVFKELVGSGLVSAKDVWSWLPVILQLLVELGPVVQDIIDRIKKAIGKGQTVETFTPA